MTTYIDIVKTSGYEDVKVSQYATIIVPYRLPVKITSKGAKTLISPGEAVILPSGVPYEVNSAAERYDIRFDFSYITNNPEFWLILPIVTEAYIIKSVDDSKKEAKGVYGCLTAFGKTSSEGEADAYYDPMDILKSMIAVSKEEDFYRTKELSLLNAFYGCLGDIILKTIRKKNSENGTGKKVEEHLSIAVGYINELHSDEIELSDIAFAAGYNKTHLSHCFKEFYDIALYDYLSRVRVASACALLFSDKVSMEELSKAAGFSSSSTFNRVFKKETGYNPRDYKHLIIK